MSLVITGPSAAVLIAVANELADRRPRTAIVDVATIRRFAVRPHELPAAIAADLAPALDWRLAIRLAAMTANAMSKDGFTVLILDVVTTESAAVYRALLGPRSKIVQLLATGDADADRLYRQQEALTAQDYRLDSTALTIAEAATALEAWL